MLLVFHLLLLILLNVLLQRLFLYHSQRMSTHHYFSLSFTDICLVLFFCQLATVVPNCHKARKKEVKTLKRKENNLLIPAKLHAPIRNTNPEGMKRTMQNIGLEDKALKFEIERIKFEIENKSIDIKDNFPHHDFYVECC